MIRQADSAQQTGTIRLKPLAKACLAALTAVPATLVTTGAAYAQVEEVVVTGTRIQTSGMQTPTPVTAVSAEELSTAVPGSLIEGMSQLPQFFGNQTANSPGSWFTRGGYGNLNLRGLGINRTLTLLNGRRMMPSTAFGGVDINVFPESIISRVETTTGGASAAYGTDAVAGVVNFYLDTNFDGLKFGAQTGATMESDGDATEFSVTYGTDIGENGHLILSGERFEQDGIFGYEGRDWYQAWGLIPINGVNQIRPNVITTSSTYDGIIFAPGSALHQQEFDSDGNISPFVVGSESFGTVGTPPARHVATGDASGDFVTRERAVLMPESERDSLFVYYDHEVSNNLTLFAQAIHSNNDNWQIPGGTSASLKGTPTAITIFQDNAFLSDAIRQTMIDENLESFTFRRMGSIDDLLGPMYFATENEMTSFTGGFSLDIESDGRFNGWTIDGYFSTGENDRSSYQHGFRVDRIHAAVDAVDDGNGNIVCRTSLSGSDYFDGCQPLNLFGRGNASREAVDWVTGNDVGEQITTPLHFPLSGGFDLGIMDSYAAHDAKINRVEYEQDLFELTATGDIAEGWAGPIALAAGVAWRDESIYQTVRDSTNRSSDHVNGHPVLCDSDPEAIAAMLRGVSPPDCANTVGIQYSKVSNVIGDSEVKEAFVETYIPVIADRRGMQSMTLGLSTRWADYSGSGQVNAWKGGLDMQFVDSFRVRFTKSRDVRAANMSERFDVTGGINALDDPRYPELGPYNITRFSGGNPAVRPEEADTTTIGFVLTPTSAPAFSLSLDWYEIEITDAIGQLGVQAVANRCEESIVAGSPSEICSLVTRDVNTDLLILVGDQYINIDEAVVSGADLEIAYRTDVDWFGSGAQTIAARVFASWLNENSEILQGVRKIDRAGQTGLEVSTGAAYALPDFKLTGNVTYTNGPYSVFLQGRYIGSGTLENAAVEGVNISSNHVDSAFYTDLRFGWIKDLSGGTTLELFGNITNLTDEDPPVTPYFSVFGGNSVQTNALLFDLLGRRYTVGLRLAF